MLISNICLLLIVLNIIVLCKLAIDNDFHFIGIAATIGYFVNPFLVFSLFEKEYSPLLHWIIAIVLNILFPIPALIYWIWFIYKMFIYNKEDIFESIDDDES